MNDDRLDDPGAGIDSLRKKIRALDDEILRTVAKRLELVEEIGRIKSESRTPLRDFEVETQVKARLHELAGDLGKDPSLGTDLALFLIRKAIEIQSPLVDAAYDGDRMRVLVIGGLGGMGKWLCSFLNVQGHHVRLHDIAAGESYFPRVNDVREAARESDLVFLAVPMSACASLLQELAGVSPPGIVVEICSLKSHLAPALDEARTSGMRVVSLHPMFGPGVRMLTGKQIVLCRAGHTDDENRVRALFEGTSARIVEVEFPEHDRYMGRVLGLAHILNIGFGDALARSGVSFDELLSVAGVTFLKQVATTREVVSENPELYYEIQSMNPTTGKVLRLLVESLGRIQETLESHRPESFAAIMQDANAWFGRTEAP